MVRLDDVTTPEPAAADETVGAQASAAPEVTPIDNDGVGVTTAGTIIWLVALIVTGLSYNTLNAHGWEWIVGTCAMGFVFGLLGIWYTVRRRSAYRAAVALGDPRVVKKSD